ncbi:MAG TPA: MAPEG family protein [Xanthobacteraceae bacterium]|jgi:uncharacterized MAPEG superfamily protein
MSMEMKLLIWSAALAFIQMLLAVTGAFLEVGLPKLAGNREDMPEITGWAGRADRAYRNMMHGLLLFAVLVLAAQITGKLDAATTLGAQLFFWGRVAYAVVYLIGLAWVRTAVWAVSVVGLVMIFSRLM